MDPNDLDVPTGIQIAKRANGSVLVTMYADPDRDCPTRQEIDMLCDQLVWSGNDRWIERCVETGKEIGADIPFAREAQGRYRPQAFPGVLIDVRHTR